MSSIFSIRRARNKKVGVARSLRSANTIQISSQTFLKENLNPTLKKFSEFWDLMETIQVHGYLRSAMSVIGRSAVGAWWSLRRYPELGTGAPELHRKRLYRFYAMPSRQWDNIKDYHSIVYKVNIAAMYLRYFGQAAFYILRDENGSPVGLDFLHGLVVPNVDAFGYFKTGEPAFLQFPANDLSYRVEFTSPKDVVYVINPDFEGSPMGGTDIEALTRHTLPIDLYLQTSAREYLQNRNKPEVIYSLPADVSDEAFETFVKEVEVRWSGPSNFGHSPITVQGEFEVKELSRFPDKLPYQTSREDAREEELAVSGVSGSKLGITKSMASANIREMRREFHETSMVPLFKALEVALYEQIHLREFGYPGWEFKFNSPDFLNAVERATVHMRYYQIGALNPNEIRYDIGKQPRQGGEAYADESGNAVPNSPGSPPEGRPVEPDAPSQTGEPTNDDQDPPRGDQHDEASRLIGELKAWRTFAVRRMKAGKRLREFRSDAIPGEVRSIVQGYVEAAQSPVELHGLFDAAISAVMEESDDYQD